MDREECTGRAVRRPLQTEAQVQASEADVLVDPPTRGFGKDPHGGSLESVPMLVAKLERLGFANDHEFETAQLQNLTAEEDAALERLVAAYEQYLKREEEIDLLFDDPSFDLTAFLAQIGSNDDVDMADASTDQQSEERSNDPMDIDGNGLDYSGKWDHLLIWLSFVR